MFGCSDWQVRAGDFLCGTPLVWLTRRAPFRAANLMDEDLTVDFSTGTTHRDVVTAHRKS
jgi:predicted glutamine amidotransferase